MKESLVSVLICTYNAEKTVTRTLNSILDQTYKNFEVLVLDNNSKDNTLEILYNYQKKDKRINIFNKGKNLGAYGGLNYLLDKAKGKYIAIQDHDDVWHPAKLEKQVKFLEKKENSKYEGCGTTTIMYYGISKVGYLVDCKEGEANCVIHTSLMFRNQGFKYDDADIYLCDVYFMKRVLCNNENKLYIIGKPLTLHYLKENGGNYSDIWFNINKKNIKKYLSLIGNDFYHILCLCFTLFCGIIPKKIKNRFEPWIMKKLHGAKSLNNNKYIKCMTKFIEK